VIAVVRWLMILAVIALAPFYGLWIAGGKLADARERKRRR